MTTNPRDTLPYTEELFLENEAGTFRMKIHWTRVDEESTPALFIDTIDRRGDDTRGARMVFSVNDEDAKDLFAILMNWWYNATGELYPPV